MDKPNSLQQLGFRIEPIKGKDQRGNEWLYRVRGKEPIFYVKRMKSGKLLAFRDKNAATDVTINGLWNFKEHNGDLVGERFSQTTGKKGPQRVSKTGNMRAA